MIKQANQIVSLVVLGFLLVACGSTPVSTHYLLTASLEKMPTQQSPALGIGPIEIPEYLNRDTLVYRNIGDSNTLNIDQQSRWAEPLEDGITRVLGLNLAGLLNTENIQNYPWHQKRRPDYGVKVRVVNLNSRDAQAVLVAEWLVYRPEDSSEVARRISSLQQPLDPEQAIAAQLPAAYSELVRRLSEEIAAGIPAQVSVQPQE